MNAPVRPRRVAILTSGGDAPGMNAAVRAVARSAIAEGVEVVGIEDGFAGLFAGKARVLGARDVGGVLDRAGSFLGSSRCLEMREKDGPQRARDRLADVADALVVVGGSGSQIGAHALAAAGARVVGVASTIDDDVYGIAQTIGVDSALGVIVEAIDRLRVTCASHRRAVLVEVMGRDTGHLALRAAVAGGAEAVVVPERPLSVEAVAAAIHGAYERGKRHALVVVSEGIHDGAAGLLRALAVHHVTIGYDLRFSVLGHVQRGGIPTPFDRLLASRAGAFAVERLLRGASDEVVGIVGGAMAALPLAEVAGRRRPLDEDLLRLAARLAA